MPDTFLPEAQNLYYFRRQSLPAVRDALERLIITERKKITAAITAPLADKMYARLEPLYLIANLEKGDNPLIMIDQELVSFLNPKLLNNFAASPEDQEVRNVLTLQLNMLSAATDTMTDVDFAPYDERELQGIIRGSFSSYYDDTVFIYTLRQLIAGDPGDKRILYLLESLSGISEKNDVTRKYLWDDALIFSLLLNVVWKSFPLLNMADQQFLLQNYLYSAIVLGVPARYWLKTMLAEPLEGVNQDELYRSFAHAIERNRENAPLDIWGEGDIALSELVKEYVAQTFSGEQIDILGQEKFLDDLYSETDDSEILKDWMREVFVTIMHLRKKDFNQTTT